ncbi:succinate-semialdehyde dehydrogenase / glutarate-semialdehyde dehydrogenase [Gordonia malaquae]|jgi:succinate-semialdehyde dehydrogenase/glutarate-semialdehyde dehydrogenase|uniref:Aldehyde dehydrogenase n=1 Tax=Gordonia malaquae NBRC 108250 TaxID=1223542 RepID=M3VGJ7_GORML|nr:succinic semialdehyde dehydrogenase [Gordonia malaquae]GAC80974.1 putative aldehyde dehydrogenase [Gordonia malaquae NBRC 108250]SEE38004.1 succinate-semialdehyde dehydrogenase / glutarate-semialdehyde dehydrogenase [Gordonia malaquae]
MPKPSPDYFARLAALIAIDGERPTKPVLEAFSGAEMATIPVGTADDIELAVARARAAQVQWGAQSPQSRAKVLNRFSELVHDAAQELMDIAQAETGKARVYAQEEVIDVALTARYYAQQGPSMLADQHVQGMLPGATDVRVRYQPKGVVGVISPWNYPLTLAVSDAVAALIAGNAVVIKPDSNTPYCALALAELLYKAGLPRELFAVVPGPGSVVGQAIVATTDYLMFTGSSATGATLAAQAGKRLIGFSAELGGKNPMIITDGVNIDDAVAGAARACYSNSGQLCISIERIYVERSIADEFTTKFAAHVKNMTLAGTYDFNADMGSLASAQQIETVQAHVDDAVAKGAKVLAGGRKRADLGPFFYEPTVLENVSDEMTCFADETFGPLVSIYPVDSVDEAIKRANDTEYGLNASVFAGSTAQAQKIAEQLRAGTVNINEGYAAAWGSTAAPMGGMGVSGVGRRHGQEGLLKYTEPQTIATQRVIGLDGIKGIPQGLFLKLTPTLLRSLKYLPGR